MPKYQQIAGVLEKRIAHGDYFTGETLTENQLASEVGVSRMTARKAILHLIERGVIERKENGRISCLPARGMPTTQVALLAPSWPSTEYQIWRYELERVLRDHGLAMRPVEYVHWDDPAIGQALESFGAVFLLPGAGEIPAYTMRRMREHRRLVVLGQDQSQHGLLSVNLFPPAHINQLLDFLRDDGCRVIDCLSPQPSDETIVNRIGQWRFWLKLNDLSGDLLSGKFSAFSLTLENAYLLMRARLDAGPPPEGVLGITINGALGAMRACLDAGLAVGRDVKIVAVNGQGMNRYLAPSITSLEGGNIRPYLELVVQWLKTPDVPWDGPRLLQPDQPTLFVGESTGRAAPGARAASPSEVATVGRKPEADGRSAM